MRVTVLLLMKIGLCLDIMVDDYLGVDTYENK